MIWNLLQNRTKQWLNQENCPVTKLITYIKEKNALRDAQIDAIEVYLYLKIAAENKPLWKLISEGFFSENTLDLNSLKISQNFREQLQADPILLSLYEFTRIKITINGKTTTLFPELEQYIGDHTNEIDALSIIKELFYEIDYTDYLFSLPMGAGKTYLMAAFMYLDLYFALNEPENKIFAHNFLVLIPSGLKSSIGPSLRNIAHFDPSWVLPEPAATQIKNMIQLEILDEPKSAKKSNKARNPNAQKVASFQPFEEQMGLIFIINAEKVILDRLEVDNLLHVIERTEDEKDKAANELRNLIGKIPNLQIYIDEVHHAATDDIKLRQVVGKWHKNDTINSVLGFSGTPYLSKAETITVSKDLKIKSTQIANTVFYYPLVSAIENFLKKPRVEQAKGLSPLQIVDKGVKDFMEHFGDKTYHDGTIAKLAIYCGNIERLETEIYPYLAGELKIPPYEILKYHKGNKDHKLPKENETEFLSLDTPLSKKKIILLVQVGKEGWDCQSLASVILSQKGDCPANMTLQTSCRCLRQKDGGDEEALIWLNEDNAKTLDKQLSTEQHTSIAEINALSKEDETTKIEMISRMEHLKLPPIDMFQMRVEVKNMHEETTPPEEKLKLLDPKAYHSGAHQTTRGLSSESAKRTSFIEQIEGEPLTFEQWLGHISKESFNDISLKKLREYEEPLKALFDTITIQDKGIICTNEVYDHEKIRSQVRLAFHHTRTLEMIEEIIPQSVQMLLVENLKPLEDHEKLYPTQTECTRILELDKSGAPAEVDPAELQKAYETMKQSLESQGMANFVPPYESFKAQHSFTLPVRSKEQTLHYLPYNFIQSGFEKTMLEKTLQSASFQDKKLEVYYNGDRALTEFRIACFEQTQRGWKRVGYYTPDFLIIKRKNSEIQKVLIVETKGAGYAAQEAFIKRKEFVENWFVPQNNQKFGYERFDYLYLSDDDKAFEATLNQKLNEFFKEYTHG